MRSALLLCIALAGCQEPGTVPDFEGQVTEFITCEKVGGKLVVHFYLRDDMVRDPVELAGAVEHAEQHVRDAEAYENPATGKKGCKEWLWRYRNDEKFKAFAEADAMLRSVGARVRAQEALGDTLDHKQT